MAKKVFSLASNIAEALTTTINTAKSNAGALNIEIIRLISIELDPENPRELSITLDDIKNVIESNVSLSKEKQQEYDELLSLANSIREHGLLNPIVVYKRGDKYFLIAGERRCLASHIAGCTDIKATVFDNKPTALKLSFLQWVENMERSDLRLYERVNNLRKIVNAHEIEHGKQDITPAFLKNILGCSWTNATNYFSVLHASPEISAAIKENKINNLEKAAFITKIDTKDIREKALQACIAGEPLKVLKAIVNGEAVQNDILNSKVPLKENIRKRGRVATKVNLGSIKDTRVIKEIASIVLNNDKFVKYKSKFQSFDWEDYSSVKEAFHLLLNIIEKSQNKT